MRPLIDHIHHVAIIAGDYNRSKDFYTRILGFEVLQEVWRAERLSWKLDLSVNGQYQIELFSFPNCRERASYPEAKGLRHLAFAVKDVDAWHAWLSEQGVAVEAIRVDEYTNKRFFFFNDPDGQPLEIYAS